MRSLTPFEDLQTKELDCTIWTAIPMDEDDFDPSLSESELSKKQVMHGVWGGM